MENKNKLAFGIFSKILIIISIIFYISSFINKNFNLIYADIPLFSLLWFEIYRIITGIFIVDNIFDLLLNILIIMTIFNFYENKEGTSKFFIKFLVNIFIFQTIMIILFLFFFYFFPIIISFTIKPIPSMGISFLIKHILLTEKKELEMMNNFKFNNRWLLIAIILIFIFLNYQEFKFEIFVSLYYGFLMCRFPAYLDRAPMEENILFFEKNDNYKFFFNVEGWISIENCFFKNNQVCIPEMKNKLNNDGYNLQNVEHIDLSDNCLGIDLEIRLDKKDEDILELE